jgi:hypothetical protein
MFCENLNGEVTIKLPTCTDWCSYYYKQHSESAYDKEWGTIRYWTCWNYLREEIGIRRKE